MRKETMTPNHVAGKVFLFKDLRLTMRWYHWFLAPFGKWFCSIDGEYKCVGFRLKNGRVFIDGWTASLNGTLQNYKEDVKIVF